MPRSSLQQYDFRGGEWSPLAQGRVNDPRYMSALALCRNHIVTEEGALVRRPGTQRVSPTRGRVKARLLKFISSTACAFVVEATPSNIQFYDGGKPVFTNDARTVSTSSYSSITNNITLGLDASHGWSVGDNVMLAFPAGYTVANEATCRGRIFQLLSGSTGSTLVLGNDVGGPVTIVPANFTTNTSLVSASVYRVLRFGSAPYAAADIPNLRLVQAQTQGIILAGKQAPQALGVTDTGSGEPTFTFGALTLVDGPYLDPQPQTLTLSALSGAITLTAGSAVFASTDVGRAVRIFTQPAAWASGTTYSAGQQVTDTAGAWWQSAINSNLGVTPGTQTLINGVPTYVWTPVPLAGTWAWGKITAFTDSTHVSFTFDTTIPNMALLSGNGTTATTWQMGVFNSAVGYPTCGCYYEGRLYLFGAVANRLDASVANGFNVAGLATGSWQFSPTDPWGTVNDSNGISETLNSKQINTIQWAEPDPQGIVIGTDNGEWLLAASALGDPITPTSIQIHQVTAYRSENIEPARAPMAMIFAQSYGRRAMEFLSDAFTQRYTGKPLNEDARHMTTAGIARIDYQSEPTPVVWAVVNDGSLIGCTYRRVSRFVTENPAVFAWHKHTHGSGGNFIDIAILPAQAGSADTFYAEVQDGGNFYVELMEPSLEVQPIASGRDGWFADASPGGAVTLGHTCGHLIPSTGFSGSATTSVAWDTGGGFSVANLPSYTPLASGSTLPPAGQAGNAFLALNEGCYLNGFSALTNIGPPKNMAKYTLSVWLYVVDPTAGALFGMSGAFDQYPLIGNGGSPQAAIGFINNTVNAADWLTTSVSFLGGTNGLAGQWVNLLISCQNTGTLFGNGSNTVVYINDTAAGGTPPTNAAAAFSTLNSGEGAGIVFGGAAQVEYNYLQTGNNASLTGNTPIPSDGGGMLAGIAELWVKFGTVLDFSVQANRRLFNATDLSSLRYAPVNLGASGQLPLGGTKPDLYLSGPPKNFVYNRANGLKITTYNNGPTQSLNQSIDPTLVTLDPLPSFIAPVS